MEPNPERRGSRPSCSPTLRTPRLVLRAWREADLPAFAALNADPAVMEFMPGRLDRAASDAMVGRLRTAWDQHGLGVWAVEAPGVAGCVGCVGLAVPRFQAAFTPCVEILWRLSSAHWGCGYATEAARAALAFGFDTFDLPEIVAFTVPANRPSRAVMERLGMQTRSPADDFDHPGLPAGHPLRRHVLYRLLRPGPSGDVSR